MALEQHPKTQNAQAGCITAGRLFCSLLLAVLAALCLGAGVPVAEAALLGQPPTATAGDPPGPSPSDTGAAKEDAAPALGNDPFAFRLALGGQVLALPCPLADLLATGWAAGLEPGALLPAGTTVDTPLALEGQQLTARLANTGAEALPWEQSLVIRLELAAATAPAVALPGGFGWGATHETLLAACGTPDAHATATRLSYTVSPQAGLAFGFGASGQLTTLALWNLHERPAAPAPTTLPPEVLAYRPPTALGSDWPSFTARYAGTLYALPAPVAAFLQNGWTLRDTGEVPAGGSLQRVCLEKGTQVLRTTLHNYSGSAQPLAGCFVTMVESSAASARLPLQLPGGITQASSLAEIEAAWGPASEVDRTGWNTRDYYWLHGDGQVVVRVERSAEQVVDLELWHQPPALPTP